MQMLQVLHDECIATKATPPTTTKGKTTMVARQIYAMMRGTPPGAGSVASSMPYVVTQKLPFPIAVTRGLFALHLKSLGQPGSVAGFGVVQP